MSFQNVDFFGGAMITRMPKAAFIDISNFRQVPDNQEVYISQSNDKIAVKLRI